MLLFMTEYMNHISINKIILFHVFLSLYILNKREKNQVMHSIRHFILIPLNLMHGESFQGCWFSKSVLRLANKSGIFQGPIYSLGRLKWMNIEQLDPLCLPVYADACIWLTIIIIPSSKLACSLTSFFMQVLALLVQFLDYACTDSNIAPSRDD